MKHSQNRQRQHDRRIFEPTEITLMRRQILLKTLRRLRQSEDRPQVHEQRGRDERETEGLLLGVLDAPGTCEHDGQQGAEDGKGEDLGGQPAEQDVVGGGGVLLVAVGGADEGRAGDLDDRFDLR